MRRALQIALFAVLGCTLAIAQTTTTVTGTIRDLSQALVTSGKVTFALNPSRDATIAGYARFSPQTVTCTITNAGLVKALDGVSACTLTMNSALQPTGTYYSVCIWPANVKTSCFTFYAVLSTYDLTTIVPTPTTSPAQNFVDVFSNQSIGGNKTWLGAQTFAGDNTFSGNNLFTGKQTITSAGLFTNTQQNNYFSSALGGINPLTWYSTVQNGNFSSDALSGGALLPLGGTVHQVNGFAGYTQSHCNSVSRSMCNAVALYGQAWDLAGDNGTGLWGGNVLCQAAGTSGNCTGLEIDDNAMPGNTFSYFVGLVLNGAGTGSLPPAFAPGANPAGGGAAAMQVVAPYLLGGGGYRWPLGLVFSRGSVVGTAVQIDAACLASADPCDSASLTFTGYDSSHAAHTVPIRGDSKGDIVLGSAVKTEGPIPSCTFTSGGGTSPSCTMDTGSTPTAGIIIATTGTGSPAGTGTITLTFAAAIGVNKPVCIYQASDNGAGQWNGLAVFKDKTPAIASDLFTWTNGSAPTALSTSTAYWINYHCWAK